MGFAEDLADFRVLGNSLGFRRVVSLKLFGQILFLFHDKACFFLTLFPERWLELVVLV